MRAFLEIVLLELRRFVRSRAAAMLLLASIGWMLAMPVLVKSDGTAEGAREMYIHFSLGGVFTLCCISLAASAAASLARDREMRRLQLTAVRPVARAAVALGRTVALTAVGAAVLAASTLILAARVGVERKCAHVLSPIMESPREEAERAYRAYMASPETPKEVKAAKKSTVIRLLSQKAWDRYQSISTNDTTTWRFAPVGAEGNPPNLAVRMRFTNNFETRDDVRGEFTYGGYAGSVSNITQAILHIPLERNGDGAPPSDSTLSFHNSGLSSLMLRPRKDINLLVAADAFGWNLARAYIQLVSILAALIAFAMLLGAGLGRSVAVFTCMAFMFVVVVSDDVVEQYPDQLETNRIDRIGLAITRAVEFVSSPVRSLRPLAALAADECVEPGETLLVFILDGLSIPAVLALLSAIAIARKHESGW